MDCCTVCKNYVKFEDQGLECECCSRWQHRSCNSNVSAEDYDKANAGEIELKGWICCFCQIIHSQVIKLIYWVSNFYSICNIRAFIYYILFIYFYCKLLGNELNLRQCFASKKKKKKMFGYFGNLKVLKIASQIK